MAKLAFLLSIPREQITLKHEQREASGVQAHLVASHRENTRNPAAIANGTRGSTGVLVDAVRLVEHICCPFPPSASTL